MEQAIRAFNVIANSPPLRIVAMDNLHIDGLSFNEELMRLKDDIIESYKRYTKVAETSIHEFVTQYLKD